MRPSGIEPEAIAWEAMILPLNQERAEYLGKYNYIYQNCENPFTRIFQQRTPHIFTNILRVCDVAIGEEIGVILPFYQRNEE